MKQTKIARRTFLRASALSGIGVLAAACAPPQPAAKPAAVATEAPKADAKPTVTAVPTPAGFTTSGGKGQIQVV